LEQVLPLAIVGTKTQIFGDLKLKLRRFDALAGLGEPPRRPDTRLIGRGVQRSDLFRAHGLQEGEPSVLAIVLPDYVIAHEICHPRHHHHTKVSSKS
jgi:hypothetical protein